jgi:hypothetical protein
VYSGPTQSLAAFSEAMGFPIPAHTNPPDFFMDLINPDFAAEPAATLDRIDRFAAATNHHCQASTPTEKGPSDSLPPTRAPITYDKAWAIFNLLCRRTLLNYSRNLLAYGVRMAMYLGTPDVAMPSRGADPKPQAWQS